MSTEDELKWMTRRYSWRLITSQLNAMLLTVLENLKSILRFGAAIVLVALVVNSCSSSSAVANEKDKKLCEGFMIVYGQEGSALVSFVKNQVNLEGTLAGYDSAREFGYAALSIAKAALEAGKSASKNGQKLFYSVGGAHADAAPAIVARGGSLGESEKEKLNAMASTLDSLMKFCDI